MGDDPAASALVSPASLAAELADTRSLVVEWRIETGHPAWFASSGNENCAAFRRWNHAFEQACANRGWLPPEDRLWPDGPRQEGDFEPLLRLPDGRTLSTGTWTLRLGGGTLEFPSLPDGVYRITLELSHLPLVPGGAAPESWIHNSSVVRRISSVSRL